MLDDEIDEFYAQGDEDGRLFQDGRGRLEFVRTLELLERVLPAAPARVLDIGGGTGVYARALADRGYAVDLVDPVETHVNRAVEVINDCGFHNSVTASVGDARSVAFATDAFDAVLMLGPLYHLTLSTDRVTAWSEAFRVARPGAVVVAVGISRYSSLLDGLNDRFSSTPTFGRSWRRTSSTASTANRSGAGEPSSLRPPTSTRPTN